MCANSLNKNLFDFLNLDTLSYGVCVGLCVCVFVCVCDARIISIHPAYYVESMCAREYAAYVNTPHK